jgi:hypothetical protein
MTLKTHNKGYLVSLGRLANKSLGLTNLYLRGNVGTDNSRLYLRKTVISLSCTSF